MLLLHQAHMLSTKFADMMFAFTCDPGELRPRFCWVGQLSLDYTFFFLPVDRQGRHFVQWYAQEVKIIHSHRNCIIVTQNGGSMPYRWKLGHVNLSYFWNCCSNTSGAPKVAALNPCLYLIDWGSWELICYLYMKYACNSQWQCNFGRSKNVKCW